jgi:hypothetical protein
VQALAMSADKSEVVMTTEAPKGLGAALGALIAIVLASIALVLSGGEHVGKKTVHGDNDLPPIAQGRQP